MISVIIRTRNEERWIRTCIEAVLEQNISQSIEIILVDNTSTDRTVVRARQIFPDIKVINVREFRPGLAINEGAMIAQGEYLVCLSAHCVPVNDSWLGKLFCNMKHSDVAGVYGKQVATPFTSSVDKRDLLLTFGPERREQRKDPFFHNANSMFRRSIWENIPFDNKITNIEDQAWGKAVIDEGYRLIYEPEAAVYHYHGIHQDNRPDRAEKVVQIMESLGVDDASSQDNPFNPENLNIAAIVPVRRLASHVESDLNDLLVKETLRCAKACRYINRIIISTDNEKVVAKSREWGAEAPFIRPPELSAPHVRIDEVLRYTLEQLESDGFYPDIVIPLEVTYPFRTPEMIDGIVEQLVKDGLDTVIAGILECRPCWMKNGSDLVPLTELSQHREKRKNIHVGLISLGCATYPQCIHLGNRLGRRVGIYEVNDPFAAIEVRDTRTMKLFEKWPRRFMERKVN